MEKITFKDAHGNIWVGNFVVVSDCINLKKAIRDTAAEYCTLDTSRKYIAKGMDYLEFMRDVPNELCLRHGFLKDTYVPIGNEKQLDESLVTEKEIHYLNDGSLYGYGTMLQVHDIELEMTRVWSKNETLGKFPAMSDVFTKEAEKNGETLQNWAKDYVTRNGQEVEEFLHYKIRAVLQSAKS